MSYPKTLTVDYSNKYMITAGLRCDDDIVVSRDQVCRSSQYGAIARKRTGSTGSGGSGGAHMTMVEGFRVLLTTLHTPTQPIPSAKNSYLSAEKVKEIEYWLAEVDPEGDAGSLEVYADLPFKEPQEPWPRSILHRL